MAIVACSTPPGVSGIAVVRISGEDAIKNVSTFVKDNPLDKAHPVSKVCFLVDKDGEIFDEAIVTSYIGPNSYTGGEFGGDIMPRKPKNRYKNNRSFYWCRVRG